MKAVLIKNYFIKLPDIWLNMAEISSEELQ